MKIVFEDSIYLLSKLSDLRKNYPEAAKLIHFIRSWQQNKTTFQFQTSGSTGLPKSIDVNRYQIVASVEATTQYLSLKNGDQVLIALDPNFVATLMMVARCLILDMDLVLERPTANPLEKTNLPIDFASFVPYQIYKMMDDGNINRLEQIKNVLIGGAPLSQSAFERLELLDTHIYATYGMTETVSHIALMRIKGNFAEASYEFLPGVSTGQDADGCLHVTGAATKQKLVQTNDIVEFVNKDSFRWLGRRDDVINSGGIKIHPEQLERVIDEYFELEAACMISWVEDEKLGAACVLLVEGSSLTSVYFESIQKSIEHNFSKHHIPRSVFTVNHFERTKSGKISREKTRLKVLDLM